MTHRDHTTLFGCETLGTVIESRYPHFAMFINVKSYEKVYEWFLETRVDKKRLEEARAKNETFYAYPLFEKPNKVYHGTDREGLSVLYDKTKRVLSEGDIEFLFKVDELYWPYCENEMMKNEKNALRLMNCFEDTTDYELLWVKSDGSSAPNPKGYEFIGYDISYAPNYDGVFSMICDCLFIPRWHGCDPEGTLFISDFNKLNDHGLFNNTDDCRSFLYKYLNQDWAETGEYLFIEIYRKNTPR